MLSLLHSLQVWISGPFLSKFITPLYSPLSCHFLSLLPLPCWRTWFTYIKALLILFPQTVTYVYQSYVLVNTQPFPIEPHCLAVLNNKVLLYSTGNYRQYLVINYNGKQNNKKEVLSSTYMCWYTIIVFLFQTYFSVRQTPGPSMSLQMTQFCSFLWLYICTAVYMYYIYMWYSAVYMYYIFFIHSSNLLAEQEQRHRHREWMCGYGVRWWGGWTERLGLKDVRCHA